ncbi:MAG: peptidylprolyl isomerase [Deltaproteobacteria bacterium]|nr:peptidylprolyl isomerase [Deltaproteobacteria bacterium]
MRMRFAICTLTLIMFMVLPSYIPESWSKTEPSSADKVAVVNGVVIIQEEFNEELVFVKQQYNNQGKPLHESQIPSLKKDILERLINRELLYQAAKKEGNTADEATINGQFETLKKRFPNEAEFKAALNKRKLSEDTLKKQIRKGIVIQKFIEKKFIQRITVPDQEIRGFYDERPDLFKQPEQVRASHILIKVDTQADQSQKAEARDKIEKIKKKLHKGEDFASLAKKFSQCPSAAKGGDLGYFRRGQMVKSFEEAAFKLKPGETSEIIETRFGYHLIKVIDKKQEGKVSYEKVQKKIESYLKQKKVQKEIKLYIEKRKEKAEISRFLTGINEH